MPRIDYYIRTLAKFGARAVFLQSNAAVVLRLVDGDRAASQTVSHADLMAMLREVVPSHLAAELAPNRVLRFPYSAEGVTAGLLVETAAQTAKVSIFADPAEAGLAEEPPQPDALGGTATASDEEPAIERTSYADERSEMVRRGGAADSTLAGLVVSARHAGASDVHLVPGQVPTLRVSGALRPLADQPSLAAGDVRLVIEDALDARALAELEECGDATGVRTIAGVGRLRIHASRTREGHVATLHLLQEPREEALPAPVRELARESWGLILAAGPAGSGRTTTLAALATASARARGGLVTIIGAPLEIDLPADRSPVIRREVPRDVPSTAAALRVAGRAGAGVVVAGDLDDDGLREAFLVAEAGALVLGVIAATTAAGGLARVTAALAGPSETRSIRVSATLRALVLHQLTGQPPRLAVEVHRPT